MRLCERGVTCDHFSSVGHVVDVIYLFLSNDSKPLWGDNGSTAVHNFVG